MSLAIAGALLDGERVTLRALNGRIAELGPDVEPSSGDEVIDADGMPLVPGLVNGHTHAAMTLFRGQGADLRLMDWLRRVVWPVESRLVDEDVYWGARLACVEMIRTGTLRFWDMYWHPAATCRAVEDAGLRATVGAPLMDIGEAGWPQALRSAAEGSLEEIGRPRELIAPALAPHAIYSVSEESLRWIAERAAVDELPIHIHLSETGEEVAQCLETHGARPAQYLDGVGLLGPRTLLAHGVWLDEEELALVAERGATVVTNPVANLKLAVGRVFPYIAARDRGVRLGIGTDGAGSNDSLDMLADLKVFALLQLNEARDPAAIAAAEAWDLATGHGSPLLAGGANLATGEPADFLLLRRDAPALAMGNLLSDLVYAASGSVVDTTVCAGRVLMRGGRVEGEAEVVERARERARGLGLIV